MWRGENMVVASEPRQKYITRSLIPGRTSVMPTGDTLNISDENVELLA